MFEVDWVKFVFERVWSPIRKQKNLVFFAALITPIKQLLNSLLSFRTTIDQQLKIGASVRELTYWINKLFDPTNQGIVIKDYNQNDDLFIFLESENRPVYLPTFIGASNYDFEVCIPCELYSQRAELKAFLDNYKLPGKVYLITWFGLCPDIQLGE